MHVDPDSRMFLSLEINIIRQIRFSFKRQKEKQRVCTSHISKKKITFFFVFLFLKSLSPSKPCESCFCCYVVLAMCVSIHLLMKCVCVCVGVFLCMAATSVDNGDTVRSFVVSFCCPQVSFLL